MTRAIAVLIALASALSGCLMPRYLAQAAWGQLDLLDRARPIEEVVADPDTDPRTRVLLSAIPDIKAFGARHGLNTKKNYRTFAQLDTSAAVWFVGAAPPLSFSPLKWCFPIVGCFAGLGWFDVDDALAQRRQLERDGWDVIARPAAAYSTGGWFPDPILSSMLSREDDAWAELADVVLHESVHATILVPDQPHFNEGVASYLGDALAEQWLIETFGADSRERIEFVEGEARREKRIARMFETYQALAALYATKRPDAEKLREKKKIIDALVEELRLRTRPNNASLVELRVYRASRGAFAEVQAACGDLTHMVAAARKLTRKDFEKSLQEDLAPVMRRMQALCREAGAKPAEKMRSGTGTGTEVETDADPAAAPASGADPAPGTPTPPATGAVPGTPTPPVPVVPPAPPDTRPDTKPR